MWKSRTRTFERVSHSFDVSQKEAQQSFTLGTLGTFGGTTIAVKLVWNVLKSFAPVLGSNYVPLLSSFILTFLFGLYLLRPKDQKLAEVVLVSFFNSLLVYEAVLGVTTTIGA